MSDTEVTQNTGSEVIWIRDIERNIVQSAIARNPFFRAFVPQAVFSTFDIYAQFYDFGKIS